MGNINELNVSSICMFILSFKGVSSQTVTAFASLIYINESPV